MPFDGLLEAARDGRPESQDRLFRVVYDELRSLARRQLERAPRAESLHPTALVHEAYVRLVGKGQLDWRSRRHFFALVARAMRDIVVERARYYSAQKRGGGRRDVTLDTHEIPVCEESDEIVMLNDALSRLYEWDRSTADVVALRYFAGLSGDETADALGVSPATIDRRWRFAKAWLRRELRDE